MALKLLADKDDITNLQTHIDETFTAPSLADVNVYVADFKNDELTITKGGLNSDERTITT